MQSGPRRILGVGILVLCVGSASALPTGFHQKDLITGLDAVSSAMLPDGRVLAIEKFGLVHLIKNDQVVPTPFLDWQANTNERYEKGMMCILADPNFSQNGYIYVQYTNNRIGVNGQDQVSRFTVVGDTVDRNSEKLMISLGDSGPQYHHGGGLAIGPDGKLYIASGCRGAVNDGPPGPGNAANPNVVEGKILRINIPNGDIPTDNPFYTLDTGDARAVYYYGVRNPFTMSFRGSTLWFSDVQANSPDDEVNQGGPAGTDYGYQDRPGQAPLWTASSAGINGRAMIGSLWYTGTQFPQLWQDLYYFGNVATDSLLAYDINHVGTPRVFGTFVCPIDVKMDYMGSLYVTTRCQTEDVRYTIGAVTKIWYGDTEPVAIATPGQETIWNALRRMSWSVLPNGRIRVDLKQGGAQSLSVLALDGKILAQKDLSEPATVEFALPQAKGMHLLVWKSGTNQAVAKILL